MDDSPKGREIEYLEGDGSAIVSRGNQVTKLGNQMISSAATLEKIADGATGQKGLAVDKLKDVVGDCYKDLKLAGERYKPTGPALVSYGSTVEDLQPKIKTAVDDCSDAWDVYTSKKNSVPSLPPFFPSGTDDDVKKKAEKKHKEAQGEADDAYQKWKTDADEFDRYYDTWEDAFDKAVNDIGKADDGGIKDSFWDNVDGFVAAALKVLQWVGVALAIAGLIIGGPIIGALAAIVAVTTLVLTAYSYARGNSSLKDLILAGVGVIPFGSLGKLFTAGKRLEFVTDMGGGLVTKAGRQAIRGNFGAFKNAGHAAVVGFQRAGGGASGIVRSVKGVYRAAAGPYGAGLGNLTTRFFTGRTVPEFLKEPPDGLSFVAGAISSVHGNINLVTKDIPHIFTNLYSAVFGGRQPATAS